MCIVLLITLYPIECVLRDIVGQLRRIAKALEEQNKRNLNP